jgi:hypothetical protein
MPSAPSDFPPARKSASHEASDEAERRRIAKMTVKERMLEALRLHALLAQAQVEGAALEER